MVQPRGVIDEEMPPPPLPGDNGDIKGSDDFLEELGTDTATKSTVKNEFDEQPGSVEEAGKQPGAKASPATMSANLQAKLWLNAFDGLQSGVFTWLHTRKKNRELGDDADAVEELAEMLDSKVLNLDDAKANPLYSKLRKLRRREKIIEEQPLSEDEYGTVIEPLQQMIKENGYVMPAWLGLTLAFGQIISSRITSVALD